MVIIQQITGILFLVAAVFYALHWATKPRLSRVALFCARLLVVAAAVSVLAKKWQGEANFLQIVANVLAVSLLVGMVLRWRKFEVVVTPPLALVTLLFPFGLRLDWQWSLTVITRIIGFELLALLFVGGIFYGLQPGSGSRYRSLFL